MDSFINKYFSCDQFRFNQCDSGCPNQYCPPPGVHGFSLPVALLKLAVSELMARACSVKEFHVKPRYTLIALPAAGRHKRAIETLNN